MRILLLAPHPFYSLRGTPIAERALLEALTDQGHTVDVLTYHEGDNPEIPGVTIDRIPAPPGVSDVPPGLSWKKVVCDLFFLVATARRLRGRCYDLVHAVEEAAFMALLLERWSGVPFVYDMDSLLVDKTVGTFEPARRVKSLLDRLETSVLRDATAVVAVCRRLEEHARRVAPDTPVYRLEDMSLLDRADAEPDDLVRVTGREGPFVLYVGNLQAVQGIDLLLEAFREVAHRHSGAELVIIGGDSERISHYADKAERLGVGPRVHLIGPRPLEELGGYLRQATLLVSPRKGGVNTPMKVYSYLHSGRPVVATRLATHTQVLDDRVSRLVEPEPTDMADGIVSLLETPEVRQRLGQAGRELAEREYTPAAFHRKARRIYEQIESEVRGATSGG